MNNTGPSGNGVVAGLQGNFSLALPNGTTIGNTLAPQLPSVGIYYIVPLTPSLQTLIGIIQNGTRQIGINLEPTGMTTGGGGYGGPPTPNDGITIGPLAWCADWTDPIYQQFYDIATTVTHQPNWVNNASLNGLLNKIPFETNSTQQLLDTEQAYNIFTQLATIIQLPLQENYFLVQSYVKNVEYSSFQFGFLYNMITMS